MASICVDCAKAPAAFATFDGAQFVDSCVHCAAKRATGPVPPWRLDDSWVVGHASVSWGVVIEHVDGWPTILSTRPGAFREQIAERSEIQAWINHDPLRTLASTTNGTLMIAQDAFGLAFAVKVPVSQDGEALLAALDAGHFTGMSLGCRGHKSKLQMTRAVRDSIPAYVFELARYPIREISFCLFPTFPRVSGTWARRGSDRAMNDFYTMLRIGMPQRLQELRLVMPQPLQELA